MLNNVVVKDNYSGAAAVALPGFLRNTAKNHFPETLSYSKLYIY